jgi:hypothetical protein
MNIPKILNLIRPDDEWTLRGTTIDDLEWHSATPKPTLEELEAGQAQLDALSYRGKRAAEYPAVGDQLDALWKGGDAVTEMLAKIQAVKAKYPKTV